MIEPEFVGLFDSIPIYSKINVFIQIYALKVIIKLRYGPILCIYMDKSIFFFCENSSKFTNIIFHNKKCPEFALKMSGILDHSILPVKSTKILSHNKLVYWPTYWVIYCIGNKIDILTQYESAKLCLEKVLKSVSS